MEKAQLLTLASSLSYTTILSIIPILAVSFAVFQAFGGIEKLYNVLEPFILSHLAPGSGQEVISTIRRLTQNANPGAIGVGGMIGLIFTSMSMLLSAEKAINQIWELKLTRGIFQRISTYWLFITLGPLGVSLALGFASSHELPVWKLFPGGTGIVLITLGFFFSVLKWVPQTEVHWKNALIGSIFTTVFWNLAAWMYSIYTRKVVTYNVVYGSLGAIPIFMLWVDIGWMILLSGVSLSATLQKTLNKA